MMLDSTEARLPPIRVQFHASGMNVAHQGQKIPGSGHFVLTVSPEKGGAPAIMDFLEGQTEVWLAPPPGAYTLKLSWRDNLQPEQVLAEPATGRMVVQ